MKVVHRSQDDTKVLELLVSDDRLKLFANVVPGPSHQSATDSELFREIAAVCPADLVDADVVKDITNHLKTGRGCEERRVGKGVAPIHGRDGRLLWLVRRHTVAAQRESDEYLPDLFHLGLFENVRKGQEIARVYPPTQGKDGRDVSGGRLAARAGRPAQIRTEKSVRVTKATGAERFDLIVSELDGYAAEESGKVSVKDTLDIPGDVDYGIGHVDFIGAVRVRGDVKKGFNVRAKGAIQIDGSVVGDNVIASDSSVSISGFHGGGTKGTIFSLGDYSVSVAEGVRAEVRGSVRIAREARECTIRCSSMVLAPQAVLVGGSLWCVLGGEFKVAGNEAGHRTRIELHNSREVTGEFESVRDAIDVHTKAVRALELHLGPFAKDRRRIPLLNQAYRDRILTLVQKYDQVTSSLAKLELKAKEMRESAPPIDNAYVSVHEKLCAGVVLAATGSELVIQEFESGPLSYAPGKNGEGWERCEFRPLGGEKT